MTLRVSKAEAAIRQVDTAIDLLFAGGDPVSIGCLAGAAFNLLGDLAEAKLGQSWREQLIVDSGLPRKQAVAALNRAGNFFKHADVDPEAILDFDEAENRDVIFMAVHECIRLKIPLSAKLQAFSVWFVSIYRDRFPPDGQKSIVGWVPGPDIRAMSETERLARGRELVVETERLLAKGAR